MGQLGPLPSVLPAHWVLLWPEWLLMCARGSFQCEFNGLGSCFTKIFKSDGLNVLRVLASLSRGASSFAQLPTLESVTPLPRGYCQTPSMYTLLGPEWLPRAWEQLQGWCPIYLILFLPGWWFSMAGKPQICIQGHVTAGGRLQRRKEPTLSSNVPDPMYWEAWVVPLYSVLYDEIKIYD